MSFGWGRRKKKNGQKKTKIRRHQRHPTWKQQGRQPAQQLRTRQEVANRRREQQKPQKMESPSAPGAEELEQDRSQAWPSPTRQPDMPASHADTPNCAARKMVPNQKKTSTPRRKIYEPYRNAQKKRVSQKRSGTRRQRVGRGSDETRDRGNPRMIRGVIRGEQTFRKEGWGRQRDVKARRPSLKVRIKKEYRWEKTFPCPRRTRANSLSSFAKPKKKIQMLRPVERRGKQNDDDDDNTDDDPGTGAKPPDEEYPPHPPHPPRGTEHSSPQHLGKPQQDQQQQQAAAAENDSLRSQSSWPELGRNAKSVTKQRTESRTETKLISLRQYSKNQRSTRRMPRKVPKKNNDAPLQ